MFRSMRRGLIRSLIVMALVSAGLLGDLAWSQVADTPTGQSQEQATQEPVSPTTQLVRDGLSTTVDEEGRSVSHEHLSSVDIATRECENRDASRTRVGLLENSAVQSHCDGITAGG
jgi:hypothetical protein